MTGFPIPPLWAAVAGAACVVFLGIAYLFQTKRIVKEFKFVLTAHRRILTMSLLCQGLFLCFIGGIALVSAFAAPQCTAGRIVLILSAVALVVSAVVTGSTGGQTDYLLLRATHLVEIVAAGMLLLGALPG